MVIFDIGLGFGVGCLLKKVEKRESFGLAAIAAGMGVAPAGLIFLNLYPDWDLQYLIPKEAVPLWFPGIFSCLIIGAALAGNWLQSRWRSTFSLFCVVYGLYCCGALPESAWSHRMHNIMRENAQSSLCNSSLISPASPHLP